RSSERCLTGAVSNDVERHGEVGALPPEHRQRLQAKFMALLLDHSADRDQARWSSCLRVARPRGDAAAVYSIPLDANTTGVAAERRQSIRKDVAARQEQVALFQQQLLVSSP